MLRAITIITLTLCVCAACGGRVDPTVATQTGGPAASPEPSPARTAAPTGAGSGHSTGSPSDEAMAVLEVTCGNGAPVLASNRVRTSPGGVRFQVTGQKGWEFGVDHASGHESVGLDADSDEIVLGIAPGDVSIDCGDPTGSSALPTTALRIEDPDGFYQTPAISDGVGSCFSQSIDYAEAARGKAAPPLRQARELLRGLRAGDLVERSGYPGDGGLVRVVRGGKVIAGLEFEQDGHGGWLFAGSTLCGGLSAG